MSSSARPHVKLVKAASSQAEVIIIGLAGDDDRQQLVGLPDSLAKDVRARLGAEVLELATQCGGSSKVGSTVVVPTGKQRLVVVGLGADEVTPEQLRRSAGSAVRTALGLAGDNAITVAISLDAAEPELVRAVTEGALLGAHQAAKVTSKPQPQRLAGLEVVSQADGKDVKQAVEVAQVVAAAVITARDWVNLPANLLYPESFAEMAREQARGIKLDVEVLDEKALAKQGFGGILAVGGGSSRQPRLVRLDHHPKGAKQHLVLVGKGITFDTGGLNLKPADGMYTMKCDMAGAAAVLAATCAIAELGLNVWVTCYASMAENMPSGTAYRPSDVLTMYGGMTVENANSDAEGRLVMADALARSREDNADLVVDVATLTGACMVALGLRTAGLMASDDATADLLLDAAESAGEDFWQLPIPEHIRSSLDSKIADLRSSGQRYGGASTAAAFLQRFVGEEQAWAHLDIAGPAFNEDAPFDYVPTGGTGSSVRTLIALASAMQA